jgi:nitrite reductase (NADH) small subunit
MQVHQEVLLEVGPLDFVGVGQGRCIIVDEKQIAIFRLRDGSVFALDNICPHRAGPLSDGIIGFDLASQLEAVVCPFHAYKFALSDGRGLDTELHVRTYPVEVRNGHIFLRLI